MSFLIVENLTKVFGAHVAVHDVSLSVERGEFVSILGPSGCGKTTVLRVVAGFETPTSGRVVIDGEDVTHVRASARKIGMVFQSYALFPNLTVEGNIAFGLRVAGTPREAIHARVDEMLKLIGLPNLRKRYPMELSGGQQQRVALARALAIRPRILLLDEPLSALDAKIRVSLREELKAIQRELSITALFVTHDQEEALAMSHRVVVMSDGHIEQIGTPSEIYRTPRTRFVATFVGTVNVLSCRVVDPVSGQVKLGEQELRLGRSLNGARVGEELLLGLRPEALRMAEPEDVGNRVRARVEEVTFLGPTVRVRARAAGEKLVVDLFGDHAPEPPELGADIDLCFRPESLQFLADH
jgi:putative spermidine/putrescine transport system ATP-binding protein